MCLGHSITKVQALWAVNCGSRAAGELREKVMIQCSCRTRRGDVPKGITQDRSTNP